MTITAPENISVVGGQAGIRRPIRMAEGDRPVLVGFIPLMLALPGEGRTRCVHLSYSTYLHICQRRETNTPEMLNLVVSRLRSVVYHPAYIGNLSGDANKVDLFAWLPEDPAGVLVSLKCLKGESWVSTAFPMGRKSLRKHLNTGKLRPVR